MDPVIADDQKIILAANRGLSEGVVSGAESVDGFVVDKESLEIIEISRVARSVEKALGCPQDMEWAVDQDLDFPKSLFWL